MKQAKILLSADGPDCNVIKLKPPMVFTKENCDQFIELFDKILREAANEDIKQIEPATILPETCKASANIQHGNEIRIKSI